MSSDQTPPVSTGLNQSGSEIDPLAHILERLQSNLISIDQYRINYITSNHTHQSDTFQQLEYLQAANDEAIAYLNLLMEVLVSMGVLDVQKALPKGLQLHLKKRAE